jgi:hypothetical protein
MYANLLKNNETTQASHKKLTFWQHACNNGSFIQPPMSHTPWRRHGAGVIAAMQGALSKRPRFIM